MLWFQYGFFSASSFNTAQTIQLLDAAPFAGSIAAGSAIARVSGHVNRVAGDERTDTASSLTLAAYSGSPSSAARSPIR